MTSEDIDNVSDTSSVVLSYQIPLNEDFRQAAAYVDDDEEYLENFEERCEWQNMLASVLTGEVIESEKSRITKTLNATQKSAGSYQLWLSLRASLHMRSIQEEKSFLESEKLQFSAVFDRLLSLKIKKITVEDCLDDVVQILSQVDYLETLYPTLRIMRLENPIYANKEIQLRLRALTSWCTTYKSLKTQTSVLKKWTGTDDLRFIELDIKAFNKINKVNEEDPLLKESNKTGASFIERMLKENNLQRTFEKRTLSVLNNLVLKVKNTLVKYHQTFKEMQLPVDFEDIKMLVSFPTILIEQCLRLRLRYAEKITKPSDYMLNQLIDDFKASLSLACKIKQDYDIITEPLEGWSIEKNVEGDYLEILFKSTKFYFMMLNIKLDTLSNSSSNKMHLQESEILEKEWSFFKDLIKRVPVLQHEIAKQHW